MNFGDESAADENSFDINVIPLIDVLLVLLIFFMASSSFVASGGIDVRLPKAAAQISLQEAKKVIVTVQPSGEIQVDGKTSAPEGLGDLFKAASESTPKPMLVLRADEKTEHGVVVHILDLAKAQGLDDVAIATVPNH